MCRNISALSLFIVSSFLLSGCLHLNRFTLYSKNVAVDPYKLRMDGIFYRFVPPYYYSNFQKDTIVDSFVLYNNGTYLDYSPYGFHPADSLKESLSIFERHKKYHGISGWGAYKVVGDTVQVQYFVSYEFKTDVYNRYYLICDNKTLEKIISQDAHKVFEEREKNVFELYLTNQKPDSTNVFTTSNRIRSKLERLYNKRQRELKGN